MTVDTWVLVLVGPLGLLLGVPALVLWAVGHLPRPRTEPAPAPPGDRPPATPPRPARSSRRHRRRARWPRAPGVHVPATGRRTCRAHGELFAGRRRRDIHLPPFWRP